jgi:hypothetical protein
VSRSRLLSNRYWFTFLMVLTLAMRVAVPSGWMPSVGADGTVITICTGTGLTEVTIDADGKVHRTSPHDKSKADAPCAFAGVGAALDVVEPVAELAAFAHIHATMAQKASDIGQGLAAPPPPSTGPPILI